MAVMSFAHLKKKENPSEVKASIQRGIISFAHLKKREKTAEASPLQNNRTWWCWRPAVMPTARLVAVNYCRGCPRYLPPGPHPIYGWCLREEDKATGYELWKVIPKTALVERCYLRLLNKKEKGLN